MLQYFDGHKLPFTLAFIFTLLNYITTQQKRPAMTKQRPFYILHLLLLTKKTMPAQYVELWTRSENFVNGKQKRYN